MDISNAGITEVGGTHPITFLPNGSVDTGNNFVAPTIKFTPNSGASDVTIKLDLGTSVNGLSQFAGSSTAVMRDQDGYTNGTLSNFTIDQTGVEEDFGQCLPEGERRILAATQGPTSGAALTGVATSPAWRTKASWFIVANRDRSIPPDLEQAMAAHIGAHSIALRTCHVAMLDLPFKVADVIADAAGEK